MVFGRSRAIGNLSLSAGETIRFTSGFHVDTGTLTVTIDPLLAP